jgi:aminoglycoside phosphotransferase (APT) family kinase protein
VLSRLNLIIAAMMAPTVRITLYSYRNALRVGQRAVQSENGIMTDSLPHLLDLLRADGVVCSSSVQLTPLAGGVSSEIYRVDDGRESFVVKRALPKLNVAAEWFADPRRNLHEQDYLRYVGAVLPGSVPQLRFASREHCYFAMELIGGDFANWKADLLAGAIDQSQAAAAGCTLGKIHRHSAGDPAATELFATVDQFRQLRIEPYLLATAELHPHLSRALRAEAERLVTCRSVLVHGDFSPKNLLVSGDRLVIIDCEVAWYGDPAFDLAFLLNHLCLKALYHAPAHWAELRAAVRAACQGYQDAWFNFPVTTEISARVSRLLPILLLARVDGKSPVEYLAETQRCRVRQFAERHILGPPMKLTEMLNRWFAWIAHPEASP